MKIHLLIVFFIFPTMARAQILKLATFPIPTMVESEDKGLFINIAKEVSRRTKIPIKIILYPTNRTLDSFLKKEVDAYFPALDVLNPGPVVKSSSFYYKNDYIFTKSGSPIKKLKDLEGKQVGLTLGYRYSSELTENKKIHFQIAPSDVSNMKKLAYGRIDAFVVEEKSGLAALKESKQKGISYDPNNKLAQHKIYFAFQDNSEGQSYARKFSLAIDAMKKDGTLSLIIKNTKIKDPPNNSEK